MVPEYSPVIRFRRKLHWKHEYWWYSPFVIQWVVLMVFSTIQYNRFALTHDFALYWQAVWLIAHGHLDPYSTVGGFSYLDNHFELIMWPLAFLYWVWPHASLLLYIQDSVLIGAEFIAWIWMQSMIFPLKPHMRRVFLALGAGLLVLNPWMYWTAAFDFHSESIVALTITGTAYALYRRNTRALVIWAGLTLLCGDVAAVALFAIGLTAFWRKQWKSAMALCLSALAWLELITYFHANQGSILAPLYGYLAQSSHSPVTLQHFSMATVLLLLIKHPLVALHELRHHEANLYANIGPEGLLGMASLWSLPLYLATVVVSNLTSYYLFGVPGFQNIMVYALLTVGTMSILVYWARRINRWVIYGLVGLLAVNSVAWAVVWFPHIPTHWIRVSTKSAVRLSQGMTYVPHSAEVIANQAIMGRIASRPWMYQLSAPGFSFPVHTDPFYLVIAPYSGVHFLSIRAQAAILNELAHMPNAHVVWEGANTYVWRVNQPIGSTFALTPTAKVLPAWTFHSQTGTRVVGGPPTSWYITGLKGSGNVLNEAYWREKPGTYRVTATIATMTTARVQVWNATTGKILFQRTVPSTNNQRMVISGTFPFSKAGSPHVYAGEALWIIHPAQGHHHNQLEVRITSGTAAYVNVYQVGIVPATTHSP